MPVISVHTSPRSTTSVVGSPKNPYEKTTDPFPKRENDLTTVGDIPKSSKNVLRSCNTSIINENFRKVFQYWRIQSCKLKYKAGIIVNPTTKLIHLPRNPEI